MNKTDIKECPFCGESASYMTNTIYGDCRPDYIECFVQCDTCEAQGSIDGYEDNTRQKKEIKRRESDYEERAIKAWNTRK